MVKIWVLRMKAMGTGAVDQRPALVSPPAGRALTPCTSWARIGRATAVTLPLLWHQLQASCMAPAMLLSRLSDCAEPAPCVALLQLLVVDPPHVSYRAWHTVQRVTAAAGRTTGKPVTAVGRTVSDPLYVGVPRSVVAPPWAVTVAVKVTVLAVPSGAWQSQQEIR